ncbi:cytochrome P450 714C2-like isoform X2 [Hevea brasiliensis]|uniref:cytochrome P450 714C2-like isoform X2 n=1 Tax=Hevea brasiliensis TaxID=3981 RepID=UPI0025D2E059|nr:cytochrome P450 714C2-like isoform X2 [Hevea brasiliensis]
MFSKRKITLAEALSSFMIGKLFKVAVGGIQLLYVNNVSIVREINRFTSLELGKPAYLQNERGALVGKGLNTTNGGVWHPQRKTVAPQLCMHKVKLKMVIQEVLRLYPGVTLATREAARCEAR